MFVGGGYKKEFVTNSVFEGNSAKWGGGIDLEGGILDVSYSTFSDNTAASGAGLSNQYAGRLTLRYSTVSSNTAIGPGGGIASADWLTVTHSTVSGNMAGSNGGGLNVGKALTLTHSTLSDNRSSGNGGGIYGNRTAGYMANSIIANNPSGGNCNGDITSQGYNLDSDGTCNLTGPGDQPNTEPMLGPLQDNGGPTWSHALLTGSPALDAGNCPGETADQRGFARPFDLHLVSNVADGCDIGAVEYQTKPVVGLEARNSGPTKFGLSTRFTATLTAGTILSYTWDFDDGEYGAGVTATHTYARPGPYMVMLEAINAEGTVKATTSVKIFLDRKHFLPLIQRGVE
jgi:hypothetical protein